MATGEGDVPEGTCGFELRPEDVGVSYDYVDAWRERIEAVSCCRDTWDGHDRCLWHADVEEKPAKEFLSARADEPERLDGAIIRSVELGGEDAFAGCRMVGASFESARLDEMNFGATDVRWAEFLDTDLKEAQFHDADLRWAEIRDVNLRNAQFEEANLEGTEFQDTRLRQVMLSDSNLQGAEFRESDILWAEIRGAHLPEIKFLETDLRWAEFRSVNLRDAKFLGADLKGVGVLDAVLSNVAVEDSALSVAKFGDVKLQNSEFRSTDLHGTIFRNATMNRTKFKNVNLRRSEFEDTGLNKAEFQNTDLSEAKFPKADLDSATVHGGDLREAEFPDASLRLTEFRETDLGVAKFPDADLRESAFSGANLRASEFPGANLQGIEVQGTHMGAAEFADADLRGTEFKDVDLRDARFPNADLRGVIITRSPDPPNQYPNLEDAVFEGADLRGTDFSDAAFYQAVFTDARINQATTFPNPTPYERDPSPEWLDDEDPLPRAAWVYRRLEALHERGAMSWRVGPYHVKKQEVERRAAYEDARSELAEGNYRDAVSPGGRYLASTVARLLTNHGESYRRVLASSAVVIVFSALLYPFTGGVASAQGDTRYHVLPNEIPTIDSLPDILSLLADGGQTAFHSGYFSVITFTTIGYGDMYPTGWGSKLLVGLESLAGAVLIALFIFVLGRRVSR